MIGQAISHNKITAKLGVGWMGEWSLMHVARLDSQVALKLLPEANNATITRLQHEGPGGSGAE